MAEGRVTTEEKQGEDGANGETLDKVETRTKGGARAESTVEERPTIGKF